MSVYLFVPNIIGYFRILSAIAAFYYAHTYRYFVFFALYAVSQLLDAVDGHMARLLNQASKFGAILDMFTDRASTVCLLMLLETLYPEYLFFFMANAALDVISHFAQLYATLTIGLGSHKDVSKTENPLLRVYYGNKLVLFFLCVGNEAFMLLMYLLKMVEAEDMSTRIVSTEYIMYGLYLATPLMLLKQFIHILQLIAAMSQLSEFDMKERAAAKKK